MSTFTENQAIGIEGMCIGYDGESHSTVESGIGINRMSDLNLWPSNPPFPRGEKTVRGEQQGKLNHGDSRQSPKYRRTEMANPNYAEIVSKAAKWLDGVEPGWHKKIDAGRLNIGSCVNCVLGQLYGRYLDGYERLRDTGGFPILAFSGLPFESPNHPANRIPTQLWRSEISARLEADARQAAKSAGAFIERTNEIVNLPARVTDTLPVEVSK